ncbi:hypothetical protein WJX77_007390 [Trebouxia sp. C0004]
MQGDGNRSALLSSGLLDIGSPPVTVAPAGSNTGCLAPCDNLHGLFTLQISSFSGSHSDEYKGNGFKGHSMWNAM